VKTGRDFLSPCFMRIITYTLLTFTVQRNKFFPVKRGNSEKPMAIYISILRGINVSGHKMIKMDALKNMYGELKFKDIQTYIQSGNVIFRHTASPVSGLEQKIKKKILDSFGFDVPVLVREVEEIRKVLKNNPFVNKRNEDVSKLHVTFLSEEPSRENLAKAQAVSSAPDEFVVQGRTVYLFCPNGYGNTKLNNTFFETKLKVTATTRNWKTTCELLNIAENPGE
jgi:uncharacterized protein (DUF1697 family)